MAVGTERYCSDAFKICFDHPAEWRVAEKVKDDGSATLKVSGIDDAGTVLALLRNREPVKAEQAAEHVDGVIAHHRKSTESSGGTVVSEEALTIAGQPAKMLVLDVHNEKVDVTIRTCVACFVLNEREHKWILAGQADLVGDSFERVKALFVSTAVASK